MKIKEVEQRVGITSKNIRFYEKEGLINPKRNEENNYRDYSEEDVILLERIKILRVLGVSISDIKNINEGNLDLESAMLLQVEALKKQQEELKGIIRVCEQIAQKDLSVEQLDESVFEDEPEVLKSRLLFIFKEDTTKEILTRKQTNFTVTSMLVYGYLLNAVIAFFFGNYLLDYMGDGMDHSFGYLFTRSVEGKNLEYITLSGQIIPFVLCIVAFFVIYFSANMVVHLVVLNLVAGVLSPILAIFFNVYIFPMNAYFHSHGDSRVLGNTIGVMGRWNMALSNDNGEQVVNTIFSNHAFAVFWLLIAVFCVLLYLLYKKNEKLVRRDGIMILFAIGYSMICVGISYILLGAILIPAIMFFAFTLYLTVCWVYLNKKPEGRSRFYAVQTGNQIMNVIGMAFSMRGKTNGPLVYR